VSLRSPRDEGSQDTPVEIRSMKVKDLPAVLTIERQAFPSPWSERVFCTEIEKNAYADYIVALHAGEIVGYAGMWLFTREAHITNIAVSPAQRRRRIGAQLLVSLMRRALLKGAERMTLEVRVSNYAARAFYINYGFVRRGLRPGYYTDTEEDALVMICADVRKTLARLS